MCAHWASSPPVKRKALTASAAFLALAKYEMVGEISPKLLSWLACSQCSFIRTLSYVATSYSTDI